MVLGKLSDQSSERAGYGLALRENPTPRILRRCRLCFGVRDFAEHSRVGEAGRLHQLRTSALFGSAQRTTWAGHQRCGQLEKLRALAQGRGEPID